MAAPRTVVSAFLVLLSELKPRLSSRRQSSRPTLEKTTLISPDAEGTESWASPNSDGLARRHFGTARSFSFGPPGLRFHRQISCLPKELNHRQIFVIQDVPHPRSVSKSFPRLWQWQLESNQMSRGTEISMASKKKGAVVRKDDVSCHFFRAHGVQVASLKFDAALDFSGGDYGEPFPFPFVWGQQVQD